MKEEELEKIVFNYEPLLKRITTKDDSEEEKKKVLKHLKHIKSRLSLKYIDNFKKVLDICLPQLYDGINFNENKIPLQNFLKTYNVILVPNHQSHVDYLAINYIFYKKYRTPLYVAGGDNLNIFPIGYLFRRSGCFFIRRSFHHDILYKLTLEAYLYYLLLKGWPIEFFFEGGRSRSGKLLPPKYGLFQMLLEAHSHLPKKQRRELLFVPVSIVHEYVPEQKTLIKESQGSQKSKESFKNLLNIVKIFSKELGSVHINLGEPITLSSIKNDDIKKQTQNLAFECFREVGKSMVVTPMSLLSLTLLDSPSETFRWIDIFSQAERILKFCHHFRIPITRSLEREYYKESLQRALHILLSNKTIQTIGKPKKEQIFYILKAENRFEILYFKHTILHHFFTAWTINFTWINLFNGSIENVHDLKKLFLIQRDQLKHEFYLPTIKEFLRNTLDILSHTIGHKINTLKECLEFTHKDFYKIASEVSVFSRLLTYVNGAYLISAKTLLSLSQNGVLKMNYKEYEKRYKDVFQYEYTLGRTIKYIESNSKNFMQTTLKYFVHQKLIKNEEGFYQIVNVDNFHKVIQRYEKFLIQQLHFCIEI